MKTATLKCNLPQFYQQPTLLIIPPLIFPPNERLGLERLNVFSWHLHRHSIRLISFSCTNCCVAVGKWESRKVEGRKMSWVPLAKLASVYSATRGVGSWQTACFILITFN